MNDYQLEKGSIWAFFYYTKELSSLNSDQEQFLIDDQTRSIVQDTFNPPPGLSPAEYSHLFMQHFMKTREKTKEIIEKDNQKLLRHRILSQLGNLECYNELFKIESTYDFHSWENQSLIDYFREISKPYLDE